MSWKLKKNNKLNCAHGFHLKNIPIELRRKCATEREKIDVSAPGIGDVETEKHGFTPW